MCMCVCLHQACELFVFQMCDGILWAPHYSPRHLRLFISRIKIQDFVVTFRAWFRNNNYLQLYFSTFPLTQQIICVGKVEMRKHHVTSKEHWSNDVKNGNKIKTKIKKKDQINKIYYFYADPAAISCQISQYHTNILCVTLLSLFPCPFGINYCHFNFRLLIS